jgi:16S rRNA (cytosine967-C5)-methyltransferase
MSVSVARRSAFEILRRVETESAFASVLLATLDPNMREDDRALCHELVLGILRRKLWLDRVIEHFAERSFGKLDLSVRLALELGLYQLRFLTRIPPSAAVNESVNLVRASREKSAAGFVNAVLRHATREPNYDPASGVNDQAERLSIETSHPVWLVTRWIDTFGFEEAAEFARANNETPPTAFRATARANHDEVIDELRAESAELITSRISPNAWRVKGASNVVRKLVDHGAIYMQDEASQLLAHALEAQPGSRVLDVTAAPGSKATHIATLAPQANVIAGDIHSHRARTLQRLAAKQGVSIHVILHDATKPLPFPSDSFDRVLLDAPCSGTGTLRRNPEIRYRLNAKDIAELSHQQRSMISNAASVLRRSGRLIYSTCSVEPEENERVVEDFLATHAEFVRVDPSGPRELVTSDGYVRTWPHRDGCDGFFIACLERRR